jgi:hypothetical protein
VTEPVDQALAPEPEFPTPAPEMLDFAYPEPEADPVEFVDFVDAPRQAVENPHDDAQTAHASHDEVPPVTLAHVTATPPPDEPYAADIEEVTQEQAVNPADTLDHVVAELQYKPLRGKKKLQPFARRPMPAIPEEERPASQIPEADEPYFLKQGRRKQSIGRALRIAMGLGSFILLLGALVQVAYIFRDQIAAHLPEAKPALLTACSLVHCNIGLPAQIETISIESDELETLNANKDNSILTMLLRNVSRTVQSWPHIELTLNDANGTMLARRVFAPREYLPDTPQVAKGFASNSEQTIKLYFEFSGVKPAGYHVGVFYP